MLEVSLDNNRLLKVVEGDITKIPVDAIVNAANGQLAGGGGVDGAIHKAGGPAIKAELSQIQGCPTGSAVMTSAGNLPAKYVFHAVGPVYQDGESGEPDLLSSCYRSCLKLADQHGVKTISFPSISAGVYGYPMDEAAEIALTEVMDYLGRPQTGVENVILVVFGKAAYATYLRVMRRMALVTQ
jgi:O-acetyl-ADP-ribose deacetylase (regulator of RNase III)